MIRDLIKWVVPGLATVLGGTTLCLAMTSTYIADDLAARGSAAMTDGGYDWAELSLDIRDLTLTGTTTEQALLDSAIARLSGISGIRSITSDVTLAPMARPYALNARLDQGTIALSGAVPSETAKQDLLSLAGTGQGALDLRSGVPNRRLWMAGAEFAIDNLQYFDQGEAVLSDLTVSFNGRAKSERAYGDLLIVMRAGAPAGLELGDVTITPALISPYRWSASFDGQRIEVSGYVPDDALAERYRTAEVSGAQVATGLAIGSGEPTGFADLSQTLLEQLARLEYGTASIVDGESSLAGAPATLQIAQGVVDALEPSGTIVVLEPPRIADYWMSATRQAGGVVVFDGYAPDEATREAFSQYQGADTSYLKLGRGAPERYRSGVDFGLDALALMSEGRIALRDNVLTIVGTARSGADYDALLALMDADAPQGLVLARAEIAAPRAATYSWSVAKDAAGAITISGLVPNAGDEATLLFSAGNRATSTMTYASGEPTGFLASAETALALLPWLRDGSVVYDGMGWTVTGTANSAIDKGAIEADFVTRQLAAAGWSMAVATPAPTIPDIAPYAWSATRAADGITLMGHVPSQSLKSYLAVHAGDSVVDSTELGSGAPDDFVAASRAGLDAVLGLEEGEVSFDGAAWSLSGRAESEAQRDAVLAALSAATDTAGWSIDISAPKPEPEPAVAPEPSVAPETAAEPEPVAEPEVVAEPEPVGETEPAVEPVAAPEAEPAVTGPQAEQAPAAVDANYAFSAKRSADAEVVLSGQLPSDPALRYLQAISGGDIAAVSLAEGAPETFLPSAETGMRALLYLLEGQLDFAQGKWSLSGITADEGARNAVLSALDADPGKADWSTTIDLPPPPPPPEPVAPKPADIAACSAPVAEFSARNSILFQSGAALIAAESEAALDELALDLAACPDAVVHIEGHTDADGDEGLNMALSVARAEAVVDALVSRGVTPARLYAVGYGETAPIADNETAQGKRLNRRIVVTVQPEHY